VSAILQHNDQGILQWIIFYYALAVLALVGIALHGGLFVAHKQEGGVVKRSLYGACLVLLVYSIVLTIISALKLADASAADAGEDAANLNDKEEKGFELGGALLGMLSVVFHFYSFRKAN
jgi:Transmembrane family 220, helix